MLQAHRHDQGFAVPHLGAHRVPAGPLQELGTRIAPALAGRDEDIPAAESVLKALEGAERVVPPIDGVRCAEVVFDR